MKRAEVARALATVGELVTLRRIQGTGPSRRNVDVQCCAIVNVGGATLLVGNVQQSADSILITDAEITAAGWPAPPRHGDQILYADGQTIVVVQNRAKTAPLDDGIAYTLTAIG